MKMQNTAGVNKTDRTTGRRWLNLATILVCGLLLVSGFFFAARQHFSSMDFGIKNSRLRHQIEQLEAEKRRLILAREVSLSPGEIRKAAKKTGIAGGVTEGQAVAQVKVPADDKAASTDASGIKPLVIRTAAVSPVASAIKAVGVTTEKSVQPSKKTVATE